MKKQISMLIAICTIVLLSFVSCDGEGGNWLYFTSSGKLVSYNWYQHQWGNGTPVTLEVLYLDEHDRIFPDRTISFRSSRSSINVKVHAEDDRELRYEINNYMVIFYDK
ncbi:MAG: hypothetical protein LBF77_01835 [Spirochaetaceae bacterium]|jgi:hypothetical protein|nr:hypothetical protein [Spirochaetaceae bacterium]